MPDRIPEDRKQSYQCSHCKGNVSESETVKGLWECDTCDWHNDPSPQNKLFAAMDKFSEEYMHGCPVVHSTFPGFGDPRNELILTLFQYRYTLEKE